MPWNDQNGNGGGGPWGSGGGSGGGNNNNGSPWGKPANNNGQGNDIETHIRNMQDRFRGRGGSGGGSGSGGGGGRLGFMGVIMLIVVLFMAWMATGMVVVNQNQSAVIFQFGKWRDNFGPGLHWHLPAPFETRRIVSIQESEVDLGQVPDESLMLTGDESIADIEFTVVWQVKGESPQDFVLNVRDPEILIRQAAESVMREIVGKSELQLLITAERDRVASQARDQLQTMMDNYKAGVSINRVFISRGDAPSQVIAAFNQVTEAEQQAVTLQNEANQYRNQTVPNARGEAAKIIQDAEAYREQIIADATGQASRFDQIYEEYRKAPRVTRERMYLETMERVLERTDKLILDNESGAVPYLPLDRGPRPGAN